MQDAPLLDCDTDLIRALATAGPTDLARQLGWPQPTLWCRIQAVIKRIEAGGGDPAPVLAMLRRTRELKFSNLRKHTFSEVTKHIDAADIASPYVWTR